MIRILLADDHRQVRKVLRATLEEHEEWQICGEACNGREAVRLALELKPDVAILDFAMPEMNGIEATQQIKKALPQVDVLIFTMYDTEELVLTARRAGARGFVRKSGDEFEIVRAIEIIVESKVSMVKPSPAKHP